MFVIRYVNTAVIDGIVNGTTRRGGRSTLSVPSCSPTGSEGPDQAFLFSQVVLSRLDPIAKTSFFFPFCFLKINDGFFFPLSATSTFLFRFAQALRVSIPEEALGSLRVSDKVVLEESQEHKSISS